MERAAEPCRGCGVVMAVLGHDVWDEPCEARCGTDIAAAVGVGAAILLRAATDTVHPPAVSTGRGMLLALHPCEHGLLPGCSTWVDPRASI